MNRFLDFLYYYWYQEVADDITFTSLDDNLFRDIPSMQQVDLLHILENKYDCLTFEQGFLWDSIADIPDEVIHSYTSGHANESFLIKTKAELSNQRWFEVTFKDNFPEIYRKIASNTDTFFKLHMSNVKHPVLYINEIPIKKFKSQELYPYKLMDIALNSPNGSIVSVDKMPKVARGERGFSQDLFDIFKWPVIRSVFMREITKTSFRIYHGVTEKDLDNIPYFQNRPRDGKTNTEHFMKMIEECRYSL